MHQNYDIETFRLQRVYQQIIQEFKGKQEPTHVPEEVFTRIAVQSFKIFNLPQTRLYEKLKLSLTDVALPPPQNGETEMFSMKQLKLLVDLY